MVVVYDMGEDRNVPGTWIVLSPLEYQFFDTESVSGVAAYYDAKINEIGHSLAIVATGTKELMMWAICRASLPYLGVFVSSRDPHHLE